MYGIIYKATGPTGLVYIGKTKDTLATRRRGHKYRAKKGDRRTPFQDALIDEGFSNFTWEQIDTAETLEELNQKEQFWITFYHSNDPAYGYNSQPGGDSGYHLSAKSREKISKKKKGIPNIKNRGENNGYSKITEATARAIKADLAAGMRICDISIKYAVGSSTVHRIKFGDTWKWVEL